MNKIFVLVCIIIILSCNVTKNIGGVYNASGRNFNHTLILNNDGTFMLNKRYFEADAKCHGKWTYLSKDSILLKCDSDTIPETIAGGYISNREQKILVLNNKKIKLQNVILRKK